MRTKTFNLFFPVFASLLSGILLVLAFPTYDLDWLGWVGLVPLLIGISGRGLAYSFFVSFVCGIIFFTGIFNWIFEVPGYRLLHHAILGLYFGPYFGFFALVYSFISRRCNDTTALFAAPFLWVTLEYMRSNMFFLALPWGLLAHSQYQCLTVIQIASLTGAYGVSFLVVMVNSALAATVLRFACRNEKTSSLFYHPPSVRGRTALVVTAAGLISLALLYGNTTLSDTLAGKGLKVSVVQGNIEQAKKWDPKYANFIMETYADLSREASDDRPALIIWPEAATPGFVLKSMALLKPVISLIRETRTYYLIGSAEYPKFVKVPVERRKFGNTALFFSAEGKLLGQYLKVRMVPFREYLPYDGIIPWPHFIVPKGKENFGFQGAELALFGLDGAKFGVAICWETIFPGLFRKFVKKGANFMINITSEASFGETAFPYQFLTLNIFRAVENRVAIARAANTGISCFIDPFGRITGKVRANNKDIFIKGYLTQEITLCQQKTFYTIYGDIFVHVILLITALIIGLSSLKGRKITIRGRYRNVGGISARIP